MNRKTATAYLGMLVAAVLLYLAIRAYGVTLPASAPAPTNEPAAPGAGPDVLGHVLLTLAVIAVAARCTGWAFERFLHQPSVMGEIAAGLILGPSVLGALWPEAQHFLLPPEVAPYVRVIANLGVVLFMFLVGLDFDFATVRRNSGVTLAISHASIVLPFLLGSALALLLYPHLGTADVGFTSFSLFMGVAMSVTAFPVLARILIDRGVQRTPLGTTALACAAVDDITAWTLLAFVAGVATAHTSGVAWTVGLVAAYLALMLGVVRPLVQKLAADREVTRGVLTVVFVALLLSAVATEWIGVHALFGAFLLGALLPHDAKIAREIRLRIDDLVGVLFLPAFFAFTGMRTRLGLLDGWGDVGATAAIIAVATAGKFGGTWLAARATGIRGRTAAALGVLMNTRGLMELIVLNVGLDLGVISPKLFTMLVMMAIVTTFSTTPVLDRLVGRREFEGPVLAAPSA